MPKKALIIFIKNYKNSKSFPSLPDGCWQDARDIGTILWQRGNWQVTLYPGVFNQERQFFKYSRDPEYIIPYDSLAKKLKTFFKDETGKDDDVLLYIIAHGFVFGEAVPKDNDHYSVRLAASDSDPQSSQKSISFEDLAKLFEKVLFRGLRSLTVLLDCCYAGKIWDCLDFNQLRTQNFAIAVACRSQEKSYIQNTNRTNSSTYFTRALKEIFCEHHQNSDKDLYFSEVQTCLKTKFDLLRKDTEASNGQTPNCSSFSTIQILSSAKQGSMSNKSIEAVLIDLQKLDYHTSRNQLIDWLDKDRKSPKMGIFYLESSSKEEITWHFSCLVKEISSYYYKHPNPKVEESENTKTFLRVLCGKEIESASYEDIYLEWTSALTPILIPVENRSCPPNLDWEKIVEKLVLLHQFHPGVPFMLCFLGKTYPPGSIKNNNVKTAFENMKAAIAANSDKFYISKFGEPSQSIVNGVSNRGIYDFRTWGYDEGRRSSLANILQVNPTMIWRVIDSMSNEARYKAANGYQSWTGFFGELEKQDIWDTIQEKNSKKNNINNIDLESIS
ncbi:caspase family protein [Phormidium yuhuli AB48]|uniref:Caspase family protein n=1 Tax=Phormidium yuhuli AB48 TaxID=2940671 RepID=A0ABY5ATR4_9CYAN|nr:caspase family protein [Phormidium yuhuli]USR92212.1 caspase family protein [Phormidium yuhuli AB48]